MVSEYISFFVPLVYSFLRFCSIFLCSYDFLRKSRYVGFRQQLCFVRSKLNLLHVAPCNDVAQPGIQLGRIGALFISVIALGQRDVVSIDLGTGDKIQ